MMSSKNDNPITYNGVVYPSEKAVCEAHNVFYCEYELRRKAGLSVHDALTTTEFGIKLLRSNPITHKGVTYESETTLCKAYNVKYNTYKSRRALGYSVERSLSGEGIKSSGYGHSIEVVYNNVTYPSESALCRAYNVKYVTYKTRRNRGMSIKQALTMKGIGKLK